MADASPTFDLTPQAPRGNAPEFTVTELAQAVKRSLEDGFGFVRLRGEVSGFRGPHASGHCYFALKDEGAKIDAVIWRHAYGRLKIKPEEGMEVVAQGRITSYPGSSKYQIVIETLEPAGAGALMALLEERKRRMTAEGLFAAERKRKLPFMPAVVGIVTSPTGAVIRDMLAGFRERFPTRVIVWGVRVQGETCGAEVAAAIRGFNALPVGGSVPRPDVLIVARGGGSLEDLWGFNDEAAVRAAAESVIPIVSAVGHETDHTLMDLAADARAPTPTKAAEWVVPKHSELSIKVAEREARLKVAVRRLIEGARVHFKAAKGGLPRLDDLIRAKRQRFDAVEQRLARALIGNTRALAVRQGRIAARLQARLLMDRLARAKDRLASLNSAKRDALLRFTADRRARLERLSGRLNAEFLKQRIGRAGERVAALDQRRLRAEAAIVARAQGRLQASAQMLGALSYQKVLERGFAILRDGNGAMVRRVADVRAGAALSVELRDGEVAAQALADGRVRDGGARGGDLPGVAADQGSPPAEVPRPRAKREKPGGGQKSLFE